MGLEFVRDEHDKRLEGLQAGEIHPEAGGDITYVHNKQEGKVYKTVNKDPRRIASFAAKGFRITPFNDPAQLLAKDPENKGGQVVGDLILMEIDVKTALTRKEMYRTKYDRQTEDQLNATKDRINRMGRDEARVTAHKDIAFSESEEK